jgi:hypothetical protein
MFITCTESQPTWKEKSKSDLVIKIDLNSRKFENLTLFKA